jgi:hypothetical protein
MKEQVLQGLQDARQEELKRQHKLKRQKEVQWWLEHRKSQQQSGDGSGKNDYGIEE